MNLKFIINLIIMIIFLSCDTTATNPNDETTTTGGDDENNLIEIYYGSDIQEGKQTMMLIKARDNFPREWNEILSNILPV